MIANGFQTLSVSAKSAVEITFTTLNYLYKHSKIYRPYLTFLNFVLIKLNEPHDFSNDGQLICLFKTMFLLTTKETSWLCIPSSFNLMVIGQ